MIIIFVDFQKEVAPWRSELQQNNSVWVSKLVSCIALGDEDVTYFNNVLLYDSCKVPVL